MSFLLNPRVLIALALACLLAFSHFACYRKGKNNVRMEWAAATAAANEDARRLERARQSRADDAGRLAAAREAGIAAATRRVAGERDGLRDAVDVARERGAQSLDACRQHAATLEDVFRQCGRQLQEVAREADGHASDSLKLQQAWPIDSLTPGPVRADSAGH